MNPGPPLLKIGVVLIPTEGLATPRQFGPSMRISYLSAMSESCFSSANPSPPTSLKPPETTIACLIPFFPHSSNIEQTIPVGSTMIAKSGVSGRSPTF